MDARENGGAEEEYFKNDETAKSSADHMSDVEEDEDDQGHICAEEMDTPPIRIAKCPGAPTYQEKEDHY